MPAMANPADMCVVYAASEGCGLAAQGRWCYLLPAVRLMDRGHVIETAELLG